MLVADSKVELIAVHVDPSTCPLTCQQGTLTQHPQVAWIVQVRANPVNQLGLSTLLELHWKLIERIPNLV